MNLGPPIGEFHLFTCTSAAGDGDLSEHQSGECSERRHQPDSIRPAGIPGGDATDNPSQHATVDANPTLVYAICRPRRKQRLRTDDQPGHVQHGRHAAGQHPTWYCNSRDNLQKDLKIYLKIVLSLS